jgi:diguanylate cyclase (GGDEF)-like protein
MVEELSIRDKLTGLYNRLKIDEVFAKAIEEASDGLGVILLDLDHFKKVNDTYGHQVGDEVLKSLARILQTHARSGDTVGRWGGEEFIVIAPKTSRDEASALAQTMREAIARFAFTKVGHKSASFGVALYQRGDTQESMTYRADKALYEAKAKGRNCVVVSQTKEG